MRIPGADDIVRWACALALSIAVLAAAAKIVLWVVT